MVARRSGFSPRFLLQATFVISGMVGAMARRTSRTDALKGSIINVDTARHVVTPKDTVVNVAGRRQAGVNRQGTEGVKRVVNRLDLPCRTGAVTATNFVLMAGSIRSRTRARARRRRYSQPWRTWKQDVDSDVSRLTGDQQVGGVMRGVSAAPFDGVATWPEPCRVRRWCSSSSRPLTARPSRGRHEASARLWPRAQLRARHVPPRARPARPPRRCRRGRPDLAA